MNQYVKPPEFRDLSGRYFCDVHKMSSYSQDTEFASSMHWLLTSVSLHRLLMSVPAIRRRYRELIVDGLASNQKLTEITKGNIHCWQGEIHFNPVQSVSPKSLVGVVYYPPLKKEEISTVLAAGHSPQDPSIEISHVSQVDIMPGTIGLDTLIPSEEIRAKLVDYALSLNLASYYCMRIRRLTKLSEGLVAQLTHRNLRLVMSIVKKETGNLNDLDAIQEGNIGLLKGISRYQPLTGFRLTTYCTWWIAKYVKQAKFSNQLIKVPFNLREAYGRVHRFLERNPKVDSSDESISLISEGTGLRESQIRQVLSESRSVVFTSELEKMGDKYLATIEFESPDETIRDIVGQLSCDDKQIFWDHLTLSPDERKKYVGTKDWQRLKSLLSNVDLCAEV